VAHPRWDEIKNAFHEAVEGSPTVRRALLERLRVSAPDVHAEVVSLLEADVPPSDAREPAPLKMLMHVDTADDVPRAPAAPTPTTGLL